MSKKVIVVLAVMLATLFVAPSLRAQPESEMDRLFAAPLGENDLAYMFLSYAGFIIRASAATVVIDSDGLLVEDDISALAKHTVDAILFTHGHGDHFNPDAARRLEAATGATIVAEAAVARTLKSLGSVPGEKIIAAVPGRPVKAGGAVIQCVVGKHVGPIVLFHVQLGRVSIFHGGDSAYVPLAPLAARIAFLPTGNPSPTASPADALKMALDVKPRVVVLMHGKESEHAEFERLAASRLPGVSVEIPKPFVTKIIRLH
jgi:L-ascorbate metabolism protein UlaG (beta-lactamase superfamily)